MPKTKFLFKFFPVLLITCNLWAVPFNVEVVKEGSGDTIRAGQLIQVHYKGFLLADLKDSSKVADTTAAADSKAKPAVKDSAAADSTAEEPAGPRPFADSYEAGQPLEFTIGMGQVIAGWDKGLIGMKVGEVRKLTVPFQMAYGENSLEGIPPYSDLYFEVELVHAEKPMEPDKFPASVDNLKWKEAAKGLKVYDEKVGTGKPAAPGAILKTHYTGWLLNGRKFGSSRDLGKPLSVVMGAGKMIKGWEQGLEGMREGGVRWFRIAPSMGYGATAYAMIPSNSTLLFRVELVSSEIDEELAATMDFFPDTTTLALENGSEGLRYAIVKPGEGEPAKSGSTVKVHYTGWLVNGYKFDSSRDRGQPFAFPLGGGRVIRGWELGVQGMLPGEKRILIVPPGLGYGSRAAGPIPGGSTLIFAVEYLGE
ncbi:MAG: FKBP-type peptidyl-prolyl cis-trans isomerase [Fibrobacter sp.]|nr:FKBP-type peptidyl-prolyl cis-trans isomerase [Fibrobacter sp.]